ncbi:cytochrome c3 family protein [Maridesulfovibrio sp.]|uniref:cytochrome c3 family protein n=1 Tax=Maridesulfovibrio sp. TaxID=2795000 RepID=UPI0029F46AB1|nr:cytochrome c3 family protein [Maridesulfovibrio sp.]
MKNRYIPITLIVAVLAVAAAAGFLFPPAVQESPARVVMDNSGGRVIFAHSVHAEEYGYECSDCHHDDIGQEKPIACGTCHPVAFDAKFRVEHQKNFPSDQACLRCHDEVPSGPLAEEDKPDTSSIPLRAEAFHSQCMGCHESDGGPYGEDSCYDCHAR